MRARATITPSLDLRLCSAILLQCRPHRPHPARRLAPQPLPEVAIPARAKAKRRPGPTERAETKGRSSRPSPASYRPPPSRPRRTALPRVRVGLALRLKSLRWRSVKHHGPSSSLKVSSTFGTRYRLSGSSELVTSTQTLRIHPARRFRHAWFAPLLPRLPCSRLPLVPGPSSSATTNLPRARLRLRALKYVYLRASLDNLRPQ